MAGILTGLIDYDCKDCNDQQKVFRSCSKKSGVPAFEWDGYKYDFCPRQYLTYDIMGWHDEYWACKEALCALPAFESRQARWYDAAMFFENTYNKMRVETIPNKEKMEKQDKELNYVFERFTNG